MEILETIDAKNLHHQRKKMQAEIQAYHQQFIHPDTGLIHAKYLQYRPCPSCSCEACQMIFQKNGGTYVRCESCDMVYLNPVFTDEALHEYYKGNNTVQAIAHENENEFYSRIYQDGLNTIQQYTKTGSLLDIGCSSGFFLGMAKAQQWSTFGIELNKVERNIAATKGHVIWSNPLEELSIDRSFDVITMWDVFEHIKNGYEYMHLIRKILSPQGVFFLQIPNVKSFAARVLWEKCNMFDGIEHVNLYAPRTIQLLAERAGFKVVSMRSVIDELQVTKNHLGYQHPYYGQYKNNLDLSFLTPELLHQNLLGYKLQIVLIPSEF